MKIAGLFGQSVFVAMEGGEAAIAAKVVKRLGAALVILPRCYCLAATEVAIGTAQSARAVQAKK